MTLDYQGKTYTVAEEKDVISAFKEQLDYFGKTTNLEIKNILRDLNYWIDQAFVSKTIAEYLMQNPGIYLVTYENGHKVYELDWDSSAPISVSALGMAAPSTPKVKKSVKRGNYMVFSPSLRNKMTGEIPVEVYNDVTRNAARYAYVKKYGAEYTDVTAKKFN